MGSEAVGQAVSRAFGLGFTGGVIMALMVLILAWVAVEGTRRR
jgi:hypothetical protein